MINKMGTRLFWIFIKRYWLKLKYKGFSASVRTFAYPNCKFSSYNSISGDAILFNTNLGNFSYVAGGQISNTTIGSFTSIGPDVKIGGFGKHPTNRLSTHPVFYSLTPPNTITFARSNVFTEFLPVTIGNDVWIGAKVLILDGIKIGDGAVIGAGSIVTKDVQPYEIVAGVPARHIRFRFSPELIDKILKNPWWNRDTDFYKKNASFFCDENISEIIKQF